MRKKLIQVLRTNEWSFDDVAFDIYQYQSSHNPVYRRFLELTGRLHKNLQTLDEIPFLPISFFKSHQVKTSQWVAEQSFVSSGTTGSRPSTHAVREEAFYLALARKGFEQQYGSLKNFHVLALLPGYLERSDSSLVAMAGDFIENTESDWSGFYLDDFKKLRDVLVQTKAGHKRTLLLGVSFALLDFAETFFGLDLSHCIIMETGGMKGRRKEIIRPVLHQTLAKAFNVTDIHSEYGMTELFSQAYSKGNGIYRPNQTMRISLREFNDPFTLVPFGKTGLINVVDLANVDSCSFIATDDIGRMRSRSEFEVLGRYDDSDVRGCNLMVSDFA